MNVDMKTDGGVWDSIVVGEVLPAFSYELTEQMVDDYQRVVRNPGAAYPTVAARHPARAFYARYARYLRIPNMGQESQLFSPPVAGRMISVSARVADKYVRRGNPYLVVEATAIDEDGRLIEISRLIGMASEAGIPAFGKVTEKWGQ